jgi:pimeloyl-ACP methyl ester carboxylesterase
MAVLAPEFDRKAFPPALYQRGGVARQRALEPHDAWSVRLVDGLVTWGQAEEKRPLPYILLGHSAGAQFLGRVAAYTPTKARRIVIANPSTYVLPNADVATPYGFGGIGSRSETQAEIARYLALPLTILLGDNDTGDKRRAKTKRAMEQGATRLERGLNTFARAKA